MESITSCQDYQKHTGILSSEFGVYFKEIALDPTSFYLIVSVKPFSQPFSYLQILKASKNIRRLRFVRNERKLEAPANQEKITVNKAPE